MKLEFGIRQVISLMLKKRKQNIYYSSGVINHKIRILALAKSYEKIVSGILIRNIYSQLGIINNALKINQATASNKKVEVQA